MNTQEVEEDEIEARKLSFTEREQFYQKKQDVLEDFWKAMGFWRIGSSEFFCCAKDPDHTSHSLLSLDDYVRPCALAFTARADDQDFPLMDPVPNLSYWEQKMYSDGETRQLLEARLQSYPATDPTWVSIDRHHDNILHVLAREAKVESLVWTLRHPFADSSRSARNLEGETPLEALQSWCEPDRTFRRDGLAQREMSDMFHGFTPDQFVCIILLSGIEDLSDRALYRVIFGCTCGQCLSGFLSPRVAFALEC